MITKDTPCKNGTYHENSLFGLILTDKLSGQVKHQEKRQHIECPSKLRQTVSSHFDQDTDLGDDGTHNAWRLIITFGGIFKRSREMMW